VVGATEGPGVTVAELGDSTDSTRFAGARRIASIVLGPTFFILGISTLVVLAGVAGYIARDDEVERLDQQLTALTSEVGKNNDVVETATARVVALSEENQQLTANLDASNDLSQDLASRLATVESAVQSTTDLETSLEGLIEERDQLRDDLSELNGTFDAQTVRFDELKTVESFGPIGNPLLFDETTDAWVTQPVCTGSMEPTIGCEDLLVVYRPTVTDLDVGDIIIFQRPGPNCQGFVNGSFLLHRITRVVSSSNGGLEFETKGDNNPSLDPCRAPVTSVTGKVLAVVQNSRLLG
jgi:signal peptidase I